MPWRLWTARGAGRCSRAPCYADATVPAAARAAGVPFCPGVSGAGSIFIGFSTANRQAAAERGHVVDLQMLPNDDINPLIAATVHATEEAILNAMLAAGTVTGINGYRVPALPHDRLREIMERAAPAWRNPR